MEVEKNTFARFLQLLILKKISRPNLICLDGNLSFSPLKTLRHDEIYNNEIYTKVELRGP